MALKVESAIAKGQIAAEELNHYRIIFAAQARGDWIAADREIAALSDMRLLGTVLAQRYLDQRYSASFTELSRWLKTFRDLPEAENIYRLAAQKAEPGDRTLKPAAPKDARPVMISANFTAGRQLAREFLRREDSVSSDAHQLVQEIISDIGSGQPSSALEQLNAKEPEFSQSDVIHARTAIAAAYFYGGDNAEARRQAHIAVESANSDAPFARWIGGLAAWRDGDYAEAAQYFAALAKIPGLSRADLAAANFWAGRAIAKLDPQSPDVRNLFRRAGSYPDTLYGLLALSELESWQSQDDAPQSLSDQQKALLNQTGAGVRALGLLSINQRDMAETELHRLIHTRDVKLRNAVFSLAAAENMPSLLIEAGGSLSGGNHGVRLDSSQFPVPDWKPANGFTADPALLYALIRQESRFNPNAESARGAIGLMQLMPDTARHIVTSKSSRGESLSNHLTDPVFNMTVGQHYLHQLSREPGINGNLVRMIAAYNWGSSNLNRWMDSSASEDPLLFIESIPCRETRDFMESVLTGYGAYRLRLGKDLAPLATLAKGQWPRFQESPAAQGDRGTQTASLFSPREH